MLRIGVLALQGAVREHIRSFADCGVEAVSVKQPHELDNLDGLVLPGGESTTMRRLIRVSGMSEALENFKNAGKPMFGTCAGLILLARKVVGEQPSQLASMDITVERNSFGRQVESFETRLNIRHVAPDFSAVFIRAPHIRHAGPQVEVLSEYDGRIVMARQGNMLGCSFHPELTGDNRISRYFIEMIKNA